MCVSAAIPATLFTCSFHPVCYVASITCLFFTHLGYFSLQRNIFIFRISQLDSVQMIQILLATSKASQSEASQIHDFFSLSGMIRGLTLASQRQELLHSPFPLMLIGLDIHSEHKCTLVSHLLYGWLGSQGEFNNGRLVKFVSSGGVLPRIFGLPSEMQCLVP